MSGLSIGVENLVVPMLPPQCESCKQSTCLGHGEARCYCHPSMLLPEACRQPGTLAQSCANLSILMRVFSLTRLVILAHGQ